MVHEDLEVRRKSGGFPAPVFYERCGGYDEGWLGQGVLEFGSGILEFVLVERGQERKGLERFAEAHLIGENTAEVVLMQVSQPCHTQSLVGSQDFSGESGHNGCRECGEIPQRTTALPPGRRRLVAGRKLCE